MARGRLVTLEGIEGVGKSSHATTVVEVLEAYGHRPLTTREPGGSPVADRIRALLLDPEGGAPAADTELLLLFAARAEHLAVRVEPALASGQWVVCDRFIDATYAYQGGGRGIATERIAALEHWVLGDLRPDLTLLFDAPVEAALERARNRGPSDRFEREQTAFFERARAAYLERARAEPARFRVIDATASLETVGAEVRRVMHTWLGSARGNSDDRG
ncbi:MAG: dTMP kinase [Halofilum sp. (in: g-proteobacteria)]